MHYREPHEHPRRILLATIGLAPQILTETLYAVAVAADPPFVPTEIHVITTAEGRHRLTLTLLDPSSAILLKFAEEFDLPIVAGALTPERIHVIADASGRPLADIGTVAHNAAAADLTARIVRELTADGEAALHVSLAGGRKTMGFLLGYALSLFGRPQDRLSHVLVDSAFEMHSDFYYPPKIPRVLTTRDGRPINTADARLLLAQIPFVRLRPGLPRELLAGALSYSQTVVRAEEGSATPELIVDHRTRRIACQGIPVPLQPRRFAFYAWLARRRKEGLGPTGDGAAHWWEATPQDTKGLLQEYRKMQGLPPGAVEDWERRLAKGMANDFFEQSKTRINAAIRGKLGFLASAYEIQPRGRIPSSHMVRIGLALEPNAIRFGPIEEDDDLMGDGADPVED